MSLKDKFIIFLLFLIFGSILAYKFNTAKGSDFNEIKQSFVKEDYEGLVVKKFYSKKHHGSPVFYVKKTGTKTIISPHKLYETIKIGDYIKKNKGDSIVEIYRDNKKTILNRRDVFDEIYFGNEQDN